MPNRYNRSTRAATQAVELAMAVPQVVAHRTLRMAQAGMTPSARDRQEFWTMGFEKVVAFNQSWFAMFADAGRIQQQFAMSALQSLWFPWLKAMPAFGQAQMRRAAMHIAAKGFAPIHQTAVANARRLGRTGR
jgi:hypothetical protein